MTANPSILYVAHADPETGIGGTELHVLDLIQAFRSRRTVYLLFREETDLVFRRYQGDDREEIRSAYPGDEAVLASFVRLLEERGVALVHFHHLLGLPLKFLEIARRQARTLVTLHDYFLYCENVDFLDETGRFCGYVSDPARCDACLNRQTGSKARSLRSPREVSPGRTESRRQYLERELPHHVLIYPSPAAQQILTDRLPRLRTARSSVIEHPVAPCLNPRLETREHGPLTVAYLGAFVAKKGSDHFREIVLRAEAELSRKVNWVVLGKIHDCGSAAEICLLENVRFLGEYRKQDVYKLLQTHRVDLGLVLSIWPETYSLTLTELFQFGIPAVVTDLGAQGARVRESGAGWTVPLEDAPAAVLEILQRLQQNPRDLERARRRVPRLPEFAAQVQLLEVLYSGGASAGAGAHAQDRPPEVML